MTWVSHSRFLHEFELRAQCGTTMPNGRLSACSAQEDEGDTGRERRHYAVPGFACWGIPPQGSTATCRPSWQNPVPITPRALRHSLPSWSGTACDRELVAAISHTLLSPNVMSSLTRSRTTSGEQSFSGSLLHCTPSSDTRWVGTCGSMLVPGCCVWVSEWQL
jgi:hypothetical protein